MNQLPFLLPGLPLLCEGPGPAADEALRTGGDNRVLQEKGPSWRTLGPPAAAPPGYTALCRHLGWGQRATQHRDSWRVIPVHVSTTAQAGVAQANTEGSVLFSSPLRSGSARAEHPAGWEPGRESPAAMRSVLAACSDCACTHAGTQARGCASAESSSYVSSHRRVRPGLRELTG